MSTSQKCSFNDVDNAQISLALANLQQLQKRIAQACARSERAAQSVILLGAAKTVEAARLETFIAAGLSDVGENYVQEGIAKKAALQSAMQMLAVRWHFIGALQSKKAKIAVREFDFIHSVDRSSLAQALDKAAGEAGKVQDVLLQINIGAEASKAGCAPDELMELAAFCARLENVQVRGLMCLPPYNEEAEASRRYFRQMRELRDELQTQNWTGAEKCVELSMGMSGNFEVAIEEGATIIRLGTVLFGHRAK